LSMKALPIAVALAAALISSAALAQTAPRSWTTADPEGQRGNFSFLGQQVGDPITKAFPDPKNQADQFGMKLCRSVNAIPSFTDCEDHSLRKTVDGIPRLDYHGVEVRFVNLRYMNDKMVGFTMGFDAAKFAAVAEVIKRQYGAPFRTENVLWKDRIGYGYNANFLTWNTPHGEMTLKERSIAMDTGSLELFTPAAERRYNDVRYRQVVD
jgi:hypothetical protein